ncbi:MAG TPA: SMP-30/gluconolactonase/LRE family protein [Acidobacteriota bacterium]|nr:SMP-30/gluconolactonase/LRE family protein [Acidobacteriota bacterium]
MWVFLMVLPGVAWGQTTDSVSTRWPMAIIDPAGVAVAADGSMVVVDTGSLRIWRISGDRLELVAGSGRGGDTPDGSPASGARLSGLNKVAIDLQGNVCFTDAGGRRIRKVDMSGILSTIVGNGEEGSTGDGGPAIKAQVKMITGLAFDPAGNLFFSDGPAGCIRKIDSHGVISTYISEGVHFPGDLAFDADGCLLVSEPSNGKILKITPEKNVTTMAGVEESGATQDGFSALKTQFDWITGFAIDLDGSLLIVERNQPRIRRIAPTGIVSTLKPVATALPKSPHSPFHRPYSIAIGPDGTRYISDKTLIKLSPSGKATSLFAPHWPKNVSLRPNRDTFFQELLDAEISPVTCFFDDYTRGSYHIHKLDLCNGIQVAARRNGYKLRGLLAIGPYGPLWAYDVIVFLEAGNQIRANRLIMPHARITWKGTSLFTLEKYGELVTSLKEAGKLTSKMPRSRKNSHAFDDWHTTVLLVDWSSGNRSINYGALDFYQGSSEVDQFIETFGRYTEHFQTTYAH